MADKDRTRVLHPAQVAARIDGQVFRGEPVRQRTRFAYALRNKDKALFGERLFGNDVPAGLALGFERNLLGQLRPARDEDRQRLGIVFRLRDQIRRNTVRIALLAGDDDFRRAGRHVDSGLMRNGDFGCGHIEIARADDLGNGCNGSTMLQGAVGHCCYCLCSTNPVELRNARQVSRRHGFAGRLGTADDDALHPGNLGRRRRHQQR